jgi:serine/threonine protein kinase
MAGDIAEIATDEGLRTGDILCGKYRILGALEPMRGELRHLALHEGTGRRIDVRILATPNDEPHKQAMLRAARAAGSAPHPSILGIIDSAVDDLGRAVFMYEYFEGVDVGTLVLRDGPFALVTAAEVVHQVASAVAALHRRGIVHRAIRPEHVLFARGDQGVRTKLTGFELAIVPPRFADAPPLPRTFSRFAAPETRRDPSDASPAADLFALGVLMRLLATGSDAAHAELAVSAARIVERATMDDVDARFTQADQLVAAVATLIPEHTRKGSVPSSDDLVADLRYLQKLAFQESGSLPARNDCNGVQRIGALAMVEAVYAQAGRALWAEIVAQVPDIEGILPRKGTLQEPPPASVSSQLVERFLEAADAILDTGESVVLSSLPGVGAFIAARGIRRFFPAYPEHLTVSAWLDCLPALYAALFIDGQLSVDERTDTFARVVIRDRQSPALPLTAVLAGLLRAELRRLSPDGAVRIVASVALGDAADVLEFNFR